LGRVLIVPDLVVKYVISVGELESNGCEVTFTKRKVRVYGEHGIAMMSGYRNENNLYVIDKITRTRSTTPVKTSSLPYANNPATCLVHEVKSSKSTIRLRPPLRVLTTPSTTTTNTAIRPVLLSPSNN